MQLKRAIAERFCQTVPRVKQLRPMLLVTMGLAVGVFLLFLLHEQEPRARGETLSTWLERAGVSWTEEAPEESKLAIREIGTNAIPILLKKLQVTDPPWKDWLQNSSFADRLPERWLYSAGVNHNEALYGFSILGTQAVSALPALEAMMSQPKSIGYALTALGHIGPPALPALRRASTNADPIVRHVATRAFVKQTDLARLAVPDLNRLSTDTNDGVATAAFQGLLRTLPNAEKTDLLIASLEHPRELRQLVALNSLSNLGTNQTMAVPVLVRLLQPTNSEVAIRAARELARIDPATASMNGVDTNILTGPRRPDRRAVTNTPASTPTNAP